MTFGTKNGNSRAANNVHELIIVFLSKCKKIYFCELLSKIYFRIESFDAQVMIIIQVDCVYFSFKVYTQRRFIVYCIQ